jgi:hypothetical protein
VPSWGSFSYAYGPIVALGVIVVLALLLRWAFSRGGSLVERPARSGTPEEYGLLLPVAVPPTFVEGEMLRRRLEAAGVRATLATTIDGPRVMVWPGDESRAKQALADR